MEFQRERVYTPLNADELRAGDKVIVDYDIAHLKEQVRCGDSFPCHEIKRINAEDITCRFYVGDGNDYPLAYLVERKENCTNCGSHEVCGYVQNVSKFACFNRCENWKPNLNVRVDNRVDVIEYSEPKTKPKASEICINCEYYSTGYCNKHDKPTMYYNVCPYFLLYNPKTEQKAEPHYRPFKDTDELIKVFCEKTPKIYDKDDEKLFMPYIWVKDKESGDIELISMFGRGEVFTREYTDLNDLFDDYTFLDGSVCGVEE